MNNGFASRFIATVGATLFAVGATVFGAGPSTQPSTQPARGDTLTVSGIVNAPAEEIFQSFTTGDGWVKAMGVAKAKVDFRVGGEIRSAYNADADLDSDRVIVNTILAYQPNRMLTIKPTPPAGSPDWLQAICRTGWNVITLEPLGTERTRVTIVGMGFEPGPEFDLAYKFFKQGNTTTLQLMQKHLGRPDAAERDARAYELLKSCVGGEWDAREVLPNGVLRGRTTWKSILNDQFIEVHGELGDDAALRSHARMLCGIDGETKSPYFFQAMETGAAARGYISLIENNTLGGVWRFTGPEGSADWYITFEFPEPDRYITRMWAGTTPMGEPLRMLEYKRAAK